MSKEVIHGHKITETQEGERGKLTRIVGLKQPQRGIKGIRHLHSRHGNTGTQGKTDIFEKQETREK